MISYPCPARDRWSALLRDELPADEQADLDAHLERCPDCQRILEDCAAHRDVWAGARKLREPSPHDVALRTVMERLKTDPDAEPVEVAKMPDILDPSDQPGSLGRVHGYEVLQEIGRGGMGIVYKALDPALHRVVAIKVMAPELAVSGSSRKRFAREARAAAAICHEHVVNIHAVDEFKGLPYLVMHYVAGQSVQDKLAKGGPLPVPEILRIGTQVAEGLAAAHKQGIVHRDVKPANILLENGVERVKLTDFSLARAVDDASVTQSGVITGTPQYMSPEQARGEPVDARSDLFGLGSVLYALCTGRPPFRGNPIEVLRKVADETPKPIREQNSDIPAWLEAIVNKLMAKDPAARYASAADVASLLGRCLAHVQQPGTVSLPPIPDFRGPRPHRRKIAVAALVALGLFVVSEATGYTQVVQAVATILRFKTDEGTLVVEVDDPNIKVTLDEKDLVITGAGPQELRLKPGAHRFLATRNGKPVKDELVEITQGGKRTVRVTFEGEEKRQTGVTADNARRGPAERRFRIEFRDTPWGDVLNWFAQISGLPFNSPYKPTGKYSFVPPKDADGREREYTIPEVVDVLNEALTVQNFLLVRRRNSFFVAPADEKIDRSQLPTVTAEALPTYGKTELVVLMHHLRNGNDQELVPQIRKMMGPFGSVIAWNQMGTGGATFFLQDTAGNLTRIVEMLKNAEGVPEKPQTRETLVVPCKYIKAVDAAQKLRDLFANDRNRTGPMVTFEADERTNNVLISGWSGKVAEATKMLAMLDAAGDETFTHQCKYVSARDANNAIKDAFAPDMKRGNLPILHMEVNGTTNTLVFKGPKEWTARAKKVVEAFDVPPPSPVPKGGPPPGQPGPGPQARTFEPRLRWEAHVGEGPVGSVAIAPNGRTIVADCGRGSRLYYLDSSSGKTLSHFEVRPDDPNAGAEDRRVRAVAISPDGRQVVGTLGNGTLVVLEAATGRELTRIATKEGVRAAAYSPDGRALASVGGDLVQMWDIGTGKQIRTFRHGGPINALAFSPDGTRIATGDGDGLARVLDVATGKELDHRIVTGPITTLAFMPDGGRLVAAERDRIYTWVLDPQAAVLRFEAGQKGVRSLAITASGKHIHTGGADGTVKVWDLQTGKEIAHVAVPGWQRSVLVFPELPYLITGGVDQGGRAKGPGARGGKPEESLRLWEIVGVQ